MPSRVAPPPALQGFRITRQWGHLSPVTLDELPVWPIESLLVLMAERPAAYRAWPTVMEWIAEAADRAHADLILRELSGRRTPTWARTGYILQAGGRQDIGDHVLSRLPSSQRGPFYLGPRDAAGTFNGRWRVRDSILRPERG